MKDHSNAATKFSEPSDDHIESKLTEQEICKINEECLAITLDSIGDGVISTDLHGRIVRMNRVAQQLTGWTFLEAKGILLSEVLKLVDSINGTTLVGPFEAAIKSGSAVSLAPNTALVDRSGVHHLIEDSASIIRRREGGVPCGLVLVFRDITQQSKLAIELEQARKLETIGRLAGGVAHDYNNTLAGIMGYSEMLISDLKLNPRSRGYARAILETSARAAKLTSQLLAFSRKGIKVSTVVDVHARIAYVVALLESSSDKRISVDVQLNALSATILGDSTLIESAFLNLLLNARDAIVIGGVINIKTDKIRVEETTNLSANIHLNPGEYIEISISDTGSGMSEEVQEHLYEPFFTTKGVGQGTGLGLSSVYGTIKEHQGAITVKSNLGEGTCFKVYLPICERTAAEIKVDDTQEYKGSGCILLVDDEQIVRETTSAVLQAIGFKVLLAENGMEALEVYKREGSHIKLVILDVVMPQLSGPDTFFALRKINKDIKVIFSSGYEFDNGASELLKQGVFGFIQKPFRKNALYKAVQKCLSDDLSVSSGVSA